MKKIIKIFTITFVLLINLNSVRAEWLPAEPMVVYWNISWITTTNKILKIYNWNNLLLKEISLNNSNYWTNKTFELNNKVILNEFSWALIFKIDNIEATISKWEITECNNNPIFQGTKICQYNLTFYEKSILNDLDNIEEEDKSETFNDIFSGKIVEKNKEELSWDLWWNLLKNLNTSEDLVVINKSIFIDETLWKGLIITSDSKKDSIYIPKWTKLSKSWTIIEEPKEITDKTTIRWRINREIMWAVDIPTNKQINFDNNIRICTNTTLTSTTWLVIYYSTDNINWYIDNSISDIRIENNQICFNVNHLTSFAVTTPIITSSNNSSSNSSSWGWWSSWKKYCNENELVCNKVWNGYKWVIKEWKTCIKSNLYNSCNISKNNNKVSNEISNNTKITTEGKNINNTNITTEGKNSIKSLSDFKISSMDYSKSWKIFTKNKKEIKKINWLEVINIKWDEEYNNKVNSIVKEINSEMKIYSIKKDMIEYLNKMTTSYWISIDEENTDEVRNIYKEKLKFDILEVEKKLIVLKRKDLIISKSLEKNNN